LVLAQADMVAAAPAGAGAVRDVCELILRAQGNWQRTMEAYQA
jgi:3-deoxy-D-manno-octulosonate 8-phosphate phosphatase KdsC-like HAD superfamily phosphatase